MQKTSISVCTQRENSHAEDVSVCTQRENAHVDDLSVCTQRENAHAEDTKQKKFLSPLCLCKYRFFFVWNAHLLLLPEEERRTKTTTTTSIIIHVVVAGCVGGGCQMTCMLQHRGGCEWQLNWLARTRWQSIKHIWRCSQLPLLHILVYVLQEHKARSNHLLQVKRKTPYLSLTLLLPLISLSPLLPPPLFFIVVVQMKDLIFSPWQKQNWFWEFLLWWYLWFVACAKCTKCSYVSSFFLLKIFLEQFSNNQIVII